MEGAPLHHTRLAQAAGAVRRGGRDVAGVDRSAAGGAEGAVHVIAGSTYRPDDGARLDWTTGTWADSTGSYCTPTLICIVVSTAPSAGRHDFDKQIRSMMRLSEWKQYSLDLYDFREAKRKIIRPASDRERSGQIKRPTPRVNGRWIRGPPTLAVLERLLPPPRDLTEVEQRRAGAGFLWGHECERTGNHRTRSGNRE